MTKEELIEYAIRSSEAIQEERKPELIDYFYKQLDKLKKQQEIIDKIRKTLEECKMLSPHEFDWEEQADNVLNILNEV